MRLDKNIHNAAKQKTAMDICVCVGGGERERERVDLTFQPL